MSRLQRRGGSPLRVARAFMLLATCCLASLMLWEIRRLGGSMAILDQDLAEQLQAQETTDRHNVGRVALGVSEEARERLYAASLALRQYLETNKASLQAAWQTRLSAQRQRGIVVSAGRTRTLTNAFVALHVIRHHLHSTLPFAIIYWSSHSVDNIDSNTMAIFKDHLSDVEFVDASKLAYPGYQRPLSPENSNGRSSGFKIKAYGIYAAPFREVLYLDADNIPLLEPSCLFETDPYQRQGNLFWPDFWSKTFATKGRQWFPGSLYQTLRLDNPWGGADAFMVRQSETGQLLLDRSRHWEVLEWMLFLNAHDDVTYHLVHGDKDTFRAAFYLAGKAGNFQQGILQLHPNGTLMFYHHNLAKYNLQGPQPAITHLTAPLSEQLAASFVGNSFTFKKEQVSFVKPAGCNHTLWDWPAVQNSCCPSYDQNLEAATQQLPLYEATADSYFAVVMAAGNVALAVFRQAMLSI